MKRKLLLAVSCLLLPLAMRAQTPTDDTFTVSDLEWDGEDYFFTVSLTGTKNYVGYNLDLLSHRFVQCASGQSVARGVCFKREQGIHSHIRSTL